MRRTYPLHDIGRDRSDSNMFESLLSRHVQQKTLVGTTWFSETSQELQLSKEARQHNGHAENSR